MFGWPILDKIIAENETVLVYSDSEFNPRISEVYKGVENVVTVYLESGKSSFMELSRENGISSYVSEFARNVLRETAVLYHNGKPVDARQHLSRYRINQDKSGFKDIKDKRYDELPTAK